MIRTTATDLGRLMQCTGYPLVGRGPVLPDEDTTLRDEGNAVHWLAQGIYEGSIDPEQAIGIQAYNGIFITGAMVEHTTAYVSRCRRHVNGQMEIGTSWSSAGFEVSGRADFVGEGPTGDELEIVDLKYGYSIVDPFENWTLISHAIGRASQMPCWPRSVTLTIDQPRAYHPLGTVRSWSFDGETLRQLFDRINQRLTLATEALETGPMCRRCPSAALCPAYREASMNAVDVVLDAPFTDNLSGHALGQELTILRHAANVVKQRLDALDELALHRAGAGEIIYGYTIDRPKGNTRVRKNVTPELVQMLTGKSVGKTVMPPIAELRLMGLGESVLDALTERPDGKPRLVAVDQDAMARRLLGKE